MRDVRNKQTIQRNDIKTVGERMKKKHEENERMKADSQNKSRNSFAVYEEYTLPFDSQTQYSYIRHLNVIQSVNKKVDSKKNW